LAHLLTLNRHRDGKSAGTGCADEEIVRDLESTLEQFMLIGEDLGEGEEFDLSQGEGGEVYSRCGGIGGVFGRLRIAAGPEERSDLVKPNGASGPTALNRDWSARRYLPDLTSRYHVRVIQLLQPGSISYLPLQPCLFHVQCKHGCKKRSEPN